MSYAEFDGIVRFTVRARAGIPAARFTLRFHKETFVASRYLTKSQCSHIEKTIEQRSVARRGARRDMSAHLSGLTDLKFRGYAVKRKSARGGEEQSPFARCRNPRIKIAGKTEMLTIDFLPPPPSSASAVLPPDCRPVSSPYQAGKASEPQRWKFSFARADLRHRHSLLNSETTDLDITVTELYYRLRNGLSTVFAGW